MAEELAVYLYGDAVAVLSRRRRSLRLTYTSAAFARYPLGSPLLSISLPLTSERYTDIPVRAFIDGLLPEGAARDAAARDIGVPAHDTYGLIQNLGKDCAGAIIFQDADEPPPSGATTLTAHPLSDAAIAGLVANLREAPLGLGSRVRLSLAGIQEKLLLTRLPDGGWGQPVDGTPSTHILKPEIARFPHTVENEAFSMRVAKHLGLPVADVETTTIGGRKLIVVERYDRVLHEDGAVVRLHQEDFCQAMAIPPIKKYEEDGGPSLTNLADIVRAVARPGGVETLLRATTLNVLLGNGDAHAKNFSLLYMPDGSIDLAPLYDLKSTLHYGDDRLAMYIDNVHRTNRVTGNHVVNEATAWGLTRQTASEVVADLLTRTPNAVALAASETEGLPEGISRLVLGQIDQIRSEFSSG